MKDLIYAARTIRKNPAFVLTVVLTLALGIGANTAIFTVVRAVLLKPLEYRDPDAVVRIGGGATPARFDEMKKAAQSYTEIGSYFLNVANVTLSGSGEPEVLRGARVSANFLDILGVAPLAGRAFRREDDEPGAPAVAMISAGLWQRRFGGDPSISGKNATISAATYTIVGVLPADFQFPFPDLDVWVAMPWNWAAPLSTAQALSPVLNLFGRLKPGVDIEQASAELIVLKQQYALVHPDMLDAKPNAATDRVVPLRDSLVGDVRSMLWMLFGAVALVLVIACSNIASLLLARAISRSREFAVRAAIGAGRRRLITQLLAESLALALLGGTLGFLLTKWSVIGIKSMTSFTLPRAAEIQPDGTVLVFALVLSIVTGVLFGLAPSLAASRPDLVNMLRGSGDAGRAGNRMRSLLVVGQIALSLVLLIGATLLMQSLARVTRVEAGFEPSNLLTMQIALPPARYETEQKRVAFVEDLVQRVEAIPGVRSAAATLTLPMTGFAGTPVQVAEGPPLKLNERPLAVTQLITHAYFRTLAIPLKRGREFTPRDKAGAPPVAMINESLARRFWPEYPNGVDPVGRRLLIGANPLAWEIVGIVGDIHHARLDIDISSGVYRPFAQASNPSLMFAVRTDGDPMQFVAAVRSQVLAIDRDQPISAVRSMEDIVEASQGQRRLMMTLLGLFAGVAFLLTLTGLYGVIAYSVAQRTREVGVRIAVGAHSGDILRLLAGHGLRLTLAGVALGLAGAYGLTRVLSSFLFQISATDPLTFGGIALLFVAVALAATYIPVRRATRLDPMTVLRCE